MDGKSLVPVDPLRFAHDKARVERDFWRKVRRTLGYVPFVEDAVAAYFCALDRETPFQVKAVLIGALAYFIVPTDMVPDFIVGLGYADDAAVVMAAVHSVANHIKPRHRDRAQQVLESETGGRQGG